MSKQIDPSTLNFFLPDSVLLGQTQFWEECDTQELDQQTILLEQEFTRQSRKSNDIKTIFLVLAPEYLYKISKKNKLKRIPLVISHLEVVDQLNEDHFIQLNADTQLRGFKMTSNTVTREIYLADDQIYNTWKQILKKKCLLSNFHESYNVLKMIGKGSFAKVYLAQSQTTNQQFAVKAFSKAYMSEQYKGRDSLLNEIKVMRNLSHPNLVRLHEVHETQNSIYFILDLVQGGELLQRVKEKGLLKADELIRIAFNLLSALEHLNFRRCFHRDLKPENLLLKSKDNNTEIIIADFGLSAFFDHELIFKRCGTPGFVAPEILQYAEGQPMYDTKCDVFSAGVIMYLLATGKQPFPGPDQKSILKANKSCQVDFGLPLFLKAPIELQDLIQKMLQYNVTDRPTASECLKHKIFSNLHKEAQQIIDQYYEEDQMIMRSNIASYDVEYAVGLKNGSCQDSSGQVGSLQLQWRKPAYNGNCNTVDSLTNCSNASFSRIEQQQIKQAPQISRFSLYSARLTKQNSIDGGIDTQIHKDLSKLDCPSPGRQKKGPTTDLHKIALKNSYHYKQQQNIIEDQVNQEDSDVSKLIKRFNSSDLIKVNIPKKNFDQGQESPKQ